MRDQRPRLSVVAVVVYDGKVLIGARRRGKYKGTYVLPGGGVEVGETLNKALVREVIEETGVQVQPGAEVVDVIEMVGKKYHRVLLVKRASVDHESVPSDTDELADVQWCPLKELEKNYDLIQPWVIDTLRRLYLI